MIRQGFSDRLLHRFALQSPRFRRFCFTRECERNHARFDPGRRNLFIAGMARSGSTALLNSLYASDAFASTCYRHMPFIMAPSLSNLIAAISGNMAAPRERRHADGIFVDLDSPEALDGIFWSTYLERDTDRILPCDADEPLLRNYAMFIENLLIHSKRERYLSKMNQRMDLLSSLAPFFRQSTFLVPFREPLQQAASLLRQHRSFARLSTYESDYLGWLDHHEFGATHAGFYTSPSRPASTYSMDSLDYWLTQWRNSYGYLADLIERHSNLLPVGYERLAASADAWRALSQRLELSLSGAEFGNHNSVDNGTNAQFDAPLMDDCRRLYARLAQQQEARGI